MFGKHFLLQAEICLQKLVPAALSVFSAAGSRSPSPSSSCLVETGAPVPPAPSVCGGTYILQDRALAHFLEWYSVWLMLSSRPPEKKVFRGFFKNNSKKGEISLVSSKGIKIRFLRGCVESESSHQVPILASLGSYYGKLQTGELSSKHLFLRVLEVGKSKVKVPAGLPGLFFWFQR